MATAPFQWGLGGQAITSPEAAARQRAIAEALVAQSATPATNWSGGLADIAAALSGTVLNGRVDDAEAAGRERAGGLFANLATNTDPNNIIAALTSPDAAWASPAQSQIASALLNQGLERSDPAYQLDMDYKRAQLEALQNPSAESFTLSPGQTRFGSDGSVLASGGVDQPSAPSGYQWDGNGGLAPIPNGPADPTVMGNKPPTDAQRRANSLFEVVAPDAALLLGDGEKPGLFDSLGNGGDQILNGVGAFGVTPLSGMASGEFQAAKDAVTNIAQSYLYATSGASAPESEVKKIADLVTPNPGDNEARKEAKRRRLETYVRAIQQASTTGQIVPPVDDNTLPSGNYVFNPTTGQLEPQ